MNGATPPVVSESLRELQWKGLVGAGRYGLVYKAFWPKLNRLVAIKRLEGELDHEKCLREVAIWAKLDHPNIVKLYHTDVVDYKKGHSFGFLVSLVMEYAPNGSLYDYLKQKQKQCKRLKEDKIIKWSHQLAQALHYLRSSSIIHRDLKSSNIVLDEKYNVKLCDFGSSRFMSRSRCVSMHGTFAWMAPELMKGQIICSMPDMGYTYCDIYSFAMVLWEMVALEVPFRDLDNEFQIVFAVCQHGERPAMPPHCPEYLRDLIEACWDESPARRPSTTEILHCLDKRNSKNIRERKMNSPDLKKPNVGGLETIPESPVCDKSELCWSKILPKSEEVNENTPTKPSSDEPKADVKPAAITRNRRAVTLDTSRPNADRSRQKARDALATRRLSLPEEEKNLALMIGAPGEFVGRGLSSA